MSGCDRIYGILDKKGAEEMELVGEVIPFEENPTVVEIQTLLHVYGYNPGAIDGVLGFRTRDAIERFQKDNGLELTRKADNETWQKMKYYRDRGWIVNGRINVAQVQVTLTENGYNAGASDGIYGARTKRAVIEFQKDHDLKQDGKVGYNTLRELDRCFKQEGEVKRAQNLSFISREQQ